MALSYSPKGSAMLPEMTHLQFFILTILLDGEQAGRDIRDKLAEQGAKKTGPAFYQLMARLEDAKWVKGWYDQKIVDGQIIKERKYKITGVGTASWGKVRDFYAMQSKLQGG